MGWSLSFRIWQFGGSWGDRHGSRHAGRGAGCTQGAWRRSTACPLTWGMCWASILGTLLSDLVPEVQEAVECTGVSCLNTIYLWFWPPAHLGCLPSLPPFHSCDSCVLLGVSKAAAILVCLSGMNGSTLWSSPLPEEARDITCLNLMPGSVAETICLVTGTHRMFSAFNATSGKGHSTEVSVWGSERSYMEGTFPLSHGGKSVWAPLEGEFKVNRERVWLGWVIGHG